MSADQGKVTAYPAHWIVGQLLDLKRFSDGTYLATLLGEEYRPERGNAVKFATAADAQSFVSAWYGTAAMRDVFHVKPEAAEPATPAPVGPDKAPHPMPPPNPPAAPKPRGRPKRKAS